MRMLSSITSLADAADRSAASWGRSARLGVWVLLALSFLATGCQNIHKRMTIRSDPPGALVLMEGEEMGYTPVSLDFVHYGTREISLVKDGYETLTVFQKMAPPWYQRLPVEFVTDNFLPVKVNNKHDFTFRMQPQVVVPSQELLDRAKGLRSETEVSP